MADIYLPSVAFLAQDLPLVLEAKLGAISSVGSALPSGIGYLKLKELPLASFLVTLF